MTFGFFLCGEKGLRVLEAVTQIPGLEIAFVMGARDAGLTADHADEIEQFCLRQAIPFWNQRGEERICREIRSASSKPPQSDHSFAVGWKWMIRDRPNLMVLHDSLLPRYRGNCPVVQMLINGEPHVGITAFQAVDEVDAGPIVHQMELPISYPVKVASVISQLAQGYAAITVDLIEALLEGHPPDPEIQNPRLASYSLWRDEQDYRIDWKRSAEWIKRFIDAVGPPYAGAFCNCSATHPVLSVTWHRSRVLDAEVVPNLEIENRESHIGKVFRVQDGCPVIVCGEGLLKLTQVTDAPKSWYRQRLV